MLFDGADVNAKDSVLGWTPLIRAASVNSSYEVPKLLIKFKAKIDTLDKESKNALLIATINGNLNFVKGKLLSHINLFRNFVKLININF